MPTPAEYLVTLKTVLGDAKMPDEVLGEHIHSRSVALDVELKGSGRSTITLARRGAMSDRLAIVIADMLDEDPVQLVNVARFYREKDSVVKAVLRSGVAKTLAALPSKTAHKTRGGMAAAVVLSLGVAAIGTPAPAVASSSPTHNCSALCIM